MLAIPAGLVALNHCLNCERQDRHSAWFVLPAVLVVSTPLRIFLCIQVHSKVFPFLQMFDPKDGRISIDLRTLVQRIISKSVVSFVPNIQKAFIEKTDPKKWILRVEGVNVKVRL